MNAKPTTCTMTFRVCGLMLLFVVAGGVAAQEGARFDHGLLWEVRTPQGAVSHLFGTIHSEDPRILDLPAPVSEALGSSAVLLIEADLTLQPDPALLQRLLLLDGRQLRDLLQEQDYGRVVEALAARGYPDMVTGFLKPWAAAVILSVPPPKTGVFLDLRLKQLAAERGITVEGLETLDEQLDTLDGMAEEDQIAMLRQTLDELPQIDALNERLVRTWLARDLGELDRLSRGNLAGIEGGAGDRLRRRLVQERNLRMVQRADSQLSRGGAFVAVGALHLAGDDGMLSLLEKRGYRVRVLY